MTDLRALAVDGARIAVRAVPGAGRNEVVAEAGKITVRVTAAAADGKANAAVLRMLAKALGIPKTRIELVRGATSRDKLIRIRPG